MKVYIAVDSEGEACVSREKHPETVYGPWQAEYTRGASPIGEIGIESLFLGAHGVPLVMVSADEAGCREAREWLGDIEVAPTRGAGRQERGRRDDRSPQLPGAGRVPPRPVVAGPSTRRGSRP
jgi:D-aminopeptidase